MSGFTCYLATNAVNGKRYVGITADPVRRWREHVYEAGAGSPFALHQAIRKHGAAAFVLSELGQVESWEVAQQMERRFIHELGTRRSDGLGYNMTDGGDGVAGAEVSEATRAKLRAALAVPAVKAKMRAAKVGRKLPPEHVAQIVPALHAPAARGKAAATNRGRKRTGVALENVREGCRQRDARRGDAPLAMHSPDARAKARESIVRAAATPVGKARRAAASTGRRQAPETCARKSAAMVAVHAARKAACAPGIQGVLDL
ncbi:MAG: GIY-YIG nuclease family protein [Acetobacteraceae bacterium]|nr:GIY-YIG nuclease family protein [Acetobacteraceae bacterium]